MIKKNARYYSRDYLSLELCLGTTVLFSLVFSRCVLTNNLNENVNDALYNIFFVANSIFSCSWFALLPASNHPLVTFLDCLLPKPGLMSHSCSVVYFDQHLGAAHPKHWSKWSFSAFFVLKSWQNAKNVVGPSPWFFLLQVVLSPASYPFKSCAYAVCSPSWSKYTTDDLAIVSF